MKTIRLAACVALLVSVTSAATAEQVLRVGAYSLPRALGNPHSSTSISEVYTWAAIFDNLTEVDGDGNVVPSLALSWHAPDPLTWRFELRRDVYFSNGEPFDADAVAATIEYITSPEARGQSVAREFTSVRGARVIDAHTVEIHTHHPTLVLPAKLAALRMVAPQHWRRVGPEGFGRDPVGTGPFIVERWGSARADLVANKRSWRPPQVDRLQIYEVRDPSARLQGIQSGNLDIALALTPDDVAPLERGGHKMYIGPGSGIVGMAFITVKDLPIKDVRVRRALNYAVDKQAIVDLLFQGNTQPAGQPATRNAQGYNPDVKPYPYDPDKARALLAEAGYPGGFDLVAEVVLSGTTAGATVYSVVSQQLARIGVNLEVRGIPIPQLIAKSVGGGFAGGAFGMEFDLKPTLDLMRGVPIHSCLRKVPWHCDQTRMPLIEAAQREFDPGKRTALMREIARAYHDDATMLFLYESIHYDGLSGRVHGYRPANRIINYDDIYITE